MSDGARRFAIVPPLVVLLVAPLPFAVPELPSGAAALTAAALVAQAAALVWCWRRPRAVLVVVAAISAAVYAGFPGNGTGELAVAVAVAAVRLATGRRRALALIVPVALVGIAVAALAGPGEPIDDAWAVPLAVARGLLVVGIPIAIAEALLARRRLLQALLERAELAERERALVAQSVAAEQRTAFARELHDIAAHHLTGIIVSTQAARALVGGDEAAQRGYLATAQREATTALEQLRLTVGLLRGGDEAPAPTLADVPALVADAAGRGVAAELAVEGEPADLGPVAELVAVRAVQEALANAARHAPGSAARVTLAWAPGSLTIDVADTGAVARPQGGQESGFGLIGLRERAALVGGTVEAGPSGRGWTTRVTVPIKAAP